jgi:hypothetical protein
MAGSGMELEPLEPAVAAAPAEGGGFAFGVGSASADELLKQLSSLDAQRFI